MKEIYVLVPNFGSEGHTPPVQAFEDRKDAMAALRLMLAVSAWTPELFSVPLWPEPAVPWMNAQSIKAE